MHEVSAHEAGDVMAARAMVMQWCGALLMVLCWSSAVQATPFQEKKSKTSKLVPSRTLNAVSSHRTRRTSPVLRATAETVTSAPTLQPPLAPPLSPGRRTLAVSSALLPGLLVHGLGHITAGRTKTGLKLLGMEVAGLALAIGGIAASGATGASRYLIGPIVATTSAGLGLFGLSWWADVMGTVVPLEQRALGLVQEPWLEFQGGYRYLYSPFFELRNLGVVGVNWRWQGLRVSPTAWLALDDDNQRVELSAGWRFWGAWPEHRGGATDSSYLEVEALTSFHRFGAEGFAAWTVGGALLGRLDLRRFDTLLSGIFAEFRLGLLAQIYDVGQQASTATSLLLADFSFGLYIPKLQAGSEVAFFYQHRDDDFAGGTKVASMANGVAVGNFGIRTKLFFHPRWGVHAEFLFASSYVVGLSAVYRLGGSS